MNQLIKNIITDKYYEVMRRFDIKLEYAELEGITEKAYRDLESFAEKDPSSNQDMRYVFKTYKSYYAVFMYRLANYLYYAGRMTVARQMSEYAKLKTGIEIHPGAKIGRNFVLDHGMGTVIGETTIIGDNCYILQNVILGSVKISNNKTGQRHPVVGDGVEIGGFVRIYGPVKIGNHVKISPGAVIKESVPDDSKIIVSSNYQILKTQTNIFYTGYCITKDKISLFFKGINLLEFGNIEVFIANKEIDDIIVTGNMISFSREEKELHEVQIVFDEDNELSIDLA